MIAQAPPQPIYDGPFVYNKADLGNRAEVMHDIETDFLIDGIDASATHLSPERVSCRLQQLVSPGKTVPCPCAQDQWALTSPQASLAKNRSRHQWLRWRQLLACNQPGR